MRDLEGWTITSPENNNNDNSDLTGWKISEAKSPETKGFKGIAQDVTKGGADYFRELGEFLTNPEQQYKALSEVGSAFGQFTGAPENPSKDLMERFKQPLESSNRRAQRNLLSGLAEGGAGLLNTPANIADYLARKGIAPEESEGLFPRLEERNYPEMFGVKGERGGDKFLRTVGGILPYILGGEAGLTGKGLTRQIAQRSGAQGLHAIGQNENPVKAALGGATASLGIPVVKGAVNIAGKAGSQISKPMNKYNNMKNGIFKDELGDIIRSGEKHGVDIFPADISSQKGIIPFASELSEKFPYPNNVAAREVQMGQAQSAARNALVTQQQKMAKTEFGGKEGLKKLYEVASGDSYRAPMAKSLLQNIENSGEDWNKIIQSSGNVSLFNRKLKADELSDKVTKIANNFGDVPEPYTTKAINESLSSINKERIPDKGTVSVLQDLKGSLENPQNYDGLRQFRRRIGSIINDYYTGSNTLIGSDGVQYLQKIKNAVDKDMEHFAKNNSPELNTAFDEFKKYYRTEVVPFKDNQLAKALKNEDSDVIYDSFIKRNKFSEGKGHSRAERFYKALDEKGREAVKTGILQKAVEHATNPKGNFSPALFAQNIESNKPALNFFKEAERKEIDDFVKLMRAVEKSGQMKLAETGAKAIPYLLGGAAFSSPVKTALAIPALIGIQHLMKSQKFAKFLAASSEKSKK